MRETAHTVTPIRNEAVRLTPGTDVGGFVIDAPLGEGAIGQVYAATHPVIAKRAAIKVLRSRYSNDDETVARFVTEARAANQIGHPNIIDVFALGQLDDGRHYLAMELVEGETLAARIKRGPLPLAEALAIIDQAASALIAAHAKGVIHRDLKPANMFLATMPDGTSIVKLLDFGIAKLVDSDDALVATRTGSMIGTPAYMAPEQARGERIDARVDVYALGIILYELLVGVRPFVHDNLVDMLFSHASAERPRPSARVAGLPPAVDALVVSLMAVEPDARPTLAAVRQTCRSMGISIPRLHTPIPTSDTFGAGMFATGPTVVATATPRPGRGLRIAAAVGILLVGLAAGFAVVLLRRADTTHASGDEAAPEKVDPAPEPRTRLRDHLDPPTPSGVQHVTVEPPITIEPPITPETVPTPVAKPRRVAKPKPRPRGHGSAKPPEDGNYLLDLRDGF